MKWLFLFTFTLMSFFCCNLAHSEMPKRTVLYMPKYGLEDVPGYSIAYTGTYAILADGTMLVFYKDHILKGHVTTLSHWEECSCTYIND